MKIIEEPEFLFTFPTMFYLVHERQILVKSYQDFLI